MYQPYLEITHCDKSISKFILKQVFSIINAVIDTLVNK